MMINFFFNKHDYKKKHHAHFGEIIDDKINCMQLCEQCMLLLCSFNVTKCYIERVTVSISLKVTQNLLNGSQTIFNRRL